MKKEAREMSGLMIVRTIQNLSYLGRPKKAEEQFLELSAGENGRISFIFPKEEIRQIICGAEHYDWEQFLEEWNR